MQRAYRPEAQNPARWRGNVDLAPPKPGKVVKVEHFEAVPIDSMPAFMKRLRIVDGMGARALEFAILTASRTGVVRAATWDEIDLDAAVWNITAVKMKSGRPHRVPLSGRAVEMLEMLPRFAAEPLVFPGSVAGKPLSDMTLTAPVYQNR